MKLQTILLFSSITACLQAPATTKVKGYTPRQGNGGLSVGEKNEGQEKAQVNAAGQKYGRERPSMGGRRARGDGGHLAALRSSTSAPTGARGSWKVHTQRPRNFHVPWRDLFSTDMTQRYDSEVIDSKEKQEAKIYIPYSGESIRLRAASGFYDAGVVEVYRGGGWGLVCDDGWDMKDAAVACRQLGFKHGAMAAPSEAFYGLLPGRWTNADIIMDDVECSGHERSLHLCDYADRHDCTVDEAASVVCKSSPGCPKGWIAGPDSCYRFLTNSNSLNAAASSCLSLGASLVAVETELENHFLSNVISLTAIRSKNLWYTSGRKSDGGWQWHQTILPKPRVRVVNSKVRGRTNNVRKRPVNSRPARQRVRLAKIPMGVSLWFPGWSPSAYGREPSAKKSHTCLALTDVYTLPNGTEVSVDYFFWKAVLCHLREATIDFICERPAQSQAEECYTGKGENYRGVHNHTELNTVCIPWSATTANALTHPGKGLGDHNYCRNPDNDKKPWCWVALGKFGYCPVPQCSETTPEPATTTSLSLAPDCPSGEFFCSSDYACIAEHLHCDGENDCDGGEDEVDCEYKSNLFEEHEGQIPLGSLTNITYLNIPLEMCASLCAKKSYVICTSYIYNKVQRRCQLLDERNITTRLLIPSKHDNYYSLLSMTASCVGGYRCGNVRCVHNSRVCDGNDDCGDKSDEEQCDATPPPMVVRLADGEEHSGRVEVHYLNEWGTVCDDHWDIRDAHVVCRMLGYSRAVRASVLSQFGPGEGNILLDNVDCSGTETSLQDCPSSPWKQHDCHSFEVAGVECLATKVVFDGSLSDKSSSHAVSTTKLSNALMHIKARVELVNGTRKNEGRVEIIRNGLRGTVCDDRWATAQADVVCRMLGFRHGGEVVLSNEFGAGDGVIWLDEVNCSGTESSLTACHHSDWTINDCSHSEDVGVRCYLTSTTSSTSTTTTPTTTPEAVRVHLVDGATPSQGRVELEIGAYRGTVCDDSWDNKDAAVVCRMAGYVDGGKAVGGGVYGEGSTMSPILLDEVDCMGTEMSLMECSHLGLGNHNCLHHEDAGVICQTDTSGYSQSPEVTQRQETTTPTDTSDRIQCGRRPLDNFHHRGQERAGLNTSAIRQLKEHRYEKIVGGSIARYGMYPWQVGVQKVYSIDENGYKTTGHWCGGTIINRHWVLSAAHCFLSLGKSQVMLKVGDYSHKVSDPGEQTLEVEELISHPSYDYETHDYDIALLKVKSVVGESIAYNNYVQAACLPSLDTSYTSRTKCYISGWGETGAGNTNILRAAAVPVLSHNLCSYLYKGELTRRMLCAGYIEGGIDTCQGDSGGPLVCDINGVYTIVGVTSWGFGCGNPRSPGVYTDTLELLSWIEETIQRHS
ncbi:uncharacterized protein LOC112565332 [Pomacea canaliculata]|uniref:uncharacterized protein LOC112565332 n=1 Tax=Pomacea canaliculata TaxID=400727 RepID=UPI000D72F745|nr:uncharacterized protein LOC112565332 [Pomacea canaliculata]